ncbi:MAG: SxtJ family membrane protein [Pyrinomonadaceae bacterium]
MVNSSQVSNKQARNTALIVSGVLLSVTAWNYYRGRMNVAAILAFAGFSLLLIGLFLPPLARRFHVAWMTLASVLGYVNSRILLFLLFYLLFTPYSLISRLFRRDPLNRRGKARETYWIPRKTSRQSREQFERSF